MRDVVFYSKSRKDVNSPKLLDILEQMPFGPQFLYVCVDPKNRNDELLGILEITDVPTMYVDGKKYVGDEAFMWLQQQIYALQNGEPAGPGCSPSYPIMQPQQQQPQHGGEYVDPRMTAMMQQQQQQQQPMYDPRVQQMQQMQQQGPPAGFAGMAMGNRMPPGVGVNVDARSPIAGNGAAGSDENGGLSGNPGGGEDSSYANPYAPTDITGLSSMTPEQAAMVVRKPMHTKDSEGPNRLDKDLEMYAKNRNSFLPEGPQNGGGSTPLPGMGGMGMQNMQMPPMRY